MKVNKIKAPCTILLAVSNIIVFFVLTSRGMTEEGEFLLKQGAMYVPYVVERGEYYRLFISMFMHFGFEHLLNNMVMLLVIGWNLEQETGKIKFLMIYVLSGFCGNVLSAYHDIHIHEFSVSAGASGAIFGIIGALLYVVIRNKGRVRDISGRSLIFMVALSLYFGFLNGGVDNYAHIGGLLSGFVLAVILYRKGQGEYGRASRD